RGESTTIWLARVMERPSGAGATGSRGGLRSRPECGGRRQRPGQRHHRIQAEIPSHRVSLASLSSEPIIALHPDTVSDEWPVIRFREWLFRIYNAGYNRQTMSRNESIAIKAHNDCRRFSST